MELAQFIEKVKLSAHTEVEKVELLALYKFVCKGEKSFQLIEILSTLRSFGYPVSNVSRLKANLAKSRSFRKVSDGEYILTPATRESLKQVYAAQLESEDEITIENGLLDEALFCRKRGFIDKLIHQINHCYDAHCYDACAVCMRRVFEISLILAYENLGIQNEIKQNGEYVMLERIVANAVSNPTLGLSRLKKEYDDIREIGNYAAHRVLYNTRKKDIDDIKRTYRVCLEELYYKAGLLK